MRQPTLVVLALFGSALWGVSAEIQPDPDDRLAYALTVAAPLPKAKIPTIEVAFGESVPSDLFSRADGERITDVHLLRHWLVRSMAFPVQGTPNPVPADLPVEALTVHRDAKVVRLELSTAVEALLDPSTHLIKIIYLRANHPDVIIGEPKKTGVGARWVGAKTADDADIYFSGKITAADSAKTAYGAELKLRHSWSLRRLGELGGRFEFAGEALENGDPDTIVFGSDYRFIDSFAPGTGLIVRSVPIGAEFDRENSTRNLLTSVEGKWILPSVHPWKRSPANLSLLSGLEGGTNYENPLQPDGGGGFLRWKIGVAAAFHTPLGEDFGFTVSALWQRRFLTSEEIFVDTVAGEETPILNDEPRNHFALDLTFDITEVFGFAVQYRNGSLPPRFEDVKSSVATSLVVKLQRVAR